MRNREASDRLADSFFDDLSFRWDVVLTGHRWIRTHEVADGSGRGKKLLLLTNGIGMGETYDYRVYSPLLTKGGLFQVFAETKLTREGISKFADEWGLLGEGEDSIHPDDAGALKIYGERFELWHDSIRETNRAVRLWKWATEKDTTSLSQLLAWQDETKSKSAGWAYCEELHESGNKPKKGVVRYNDFLDLKSYPDLRRKDICAAALRFVQKWIDLNLGPRCGPRVLWHFERREYCLRIMPSSLLGAIWWQFARAFVGDIRFRPCKVCSKPIEISSEAFREDREFCSPACRQRDHRHKVAEAKGLRRRPVAQANRKTLRATHDRR